MSMKMSLVAVSRELLEKARTAKSGRSATSILSGHELVLRQTVIALCGGRTLDEHDSPGEATLQVLSGRVRLISGDVEWIGMAGDLIIIPPARHSVEADEDSTLLLTVAKNL